MSTETIILGVATLPAVLGDCPNCRKGKGGFGGTGGMRLGGGGEGGGGEGGGGAGGGLLRGEAGGGLRPDAGGDGGPGVVAFVMFWPGAGGGGKGAGGLGGRGVSGPGNKTPLISKITFCVHTHTRTHTNDTLASDTSQTRAPAPAMPNLLPHSCGWQQKKVWNTGGKSCSLRDSIPRPGSQAPHLARKEVYPCDVDREGVALGLYCHVTVPVGR